ncbi:hypothetical protein [Clostridium tertium]|uniref:DUF6385 domain-containing protein n=1 Tax=Clostridium tertium TaxID=1559 RepID=A0A6N2YDW8_9CLOT
MNNLLFNTVASELKTSIYAQAPDGSLQILQTDSTGALKTSISNSSLTVNVNNPITVANAITIANTSLTVSVSNPITIANASLTVSVNNPITVANSITIANTTLTVVVNNPITVNNAITIANSSLTVTIGANAFTSSSALNLSVSGTGRVLNNTDISTLRTASFFVYNAGTNTLTISLQMSPTTNNADYITDPSYNNYTIPGGDRRIITVSRFGNYTRLLYTLRGTTATFSVYFNGQG